MGRVIAFVPVRGGSQSIPSKNIKSFCGKPLIYWNLKALEKAEKVDEVVVSTDSEKIYKIVEDFEFSKVSIFNRDPSNATNTSSTETVILEYLHKNEYASDSVFMLVQATAPFTQSTDFDQALRKYDEGIFDSMLSCSRIKKFLWNENGTPSNYDYQNRPRRQEFKGQLVENGAFYINTIDSILKNKNRLFGNIGIYEMPEYTGSELDEEDDWDIAENLMQKHVLKLFAQKKSIKLFLTDVDGVLTDAGMYYTENGDELKKFNTKDGKGFELLRNVHIKTGIITSENTKIVEERAKKLKVDYLYQGVTNKLKIVKEICEKENISLNHVAYIGDDLNDKELLENVGLAACPIDAQENIKKIKGIYSLSQKGGEGAVRSFCEYVIYTKNCSQKT